MREPITEQTRHALVQAQAAARQLNQDFVGTEHMVLGILDCPESEAVRAVMGGEVTPEELRKRLLAELPRGSKPPVVTGSLPLSPKAQRAFNNALVKAETLREPRVSTRLVLLALVEEPDTDIRSAFTEAGIDLEHLARLLAKKPAQPET